MKHKVIKTKDGSSTLYVEELDEHYHSIHGAVNEALHVFIENGLNKIAEKKQDIAIFEIGFGTGLNALVTQDFALKHNLNIQYSAIEKYPISSDVCAHLNYVEFIENKALNIFFTDLHTSAWQKPIDITPQFTLEKIKDDIKTYKFTSTFDLIYFDAFGPRAQQEMWDKAIFQKLYDALNPNGIFVTYCAKGQVRRDLASVGFDVERLPGPPGKREMLRGIKN